MSDDKRRRVDEFWDLASLLPKKRRASLPQQHPDVSTVPIEAPPLPMDKTVPTSPEIAGDFSTIPQRFREVERPGAQKEQKNPDPQGKNETASTAEIMNTGSFGEKYALMRSALRSNTGVGAEVKIVTETKKDNKPASHSSGKNSGIYKKDVSSDVRINIKIDEDDIISRVVRGVADIVGSLTNGIRERTNTYNTGHDQKKAEVEALKEEIYEPEGGLIKRVKITRWPGRFNFYEGFREDAMRYHRLKGKPCPYVQFFSYTPQYRHMNAAQSAYYLYFRECVRSGNPIKADLSYVLLYVYEIINLYDVIPPERGLSLLLDIWLFYKDQHKPLNKYLAEWVCDYCLIHKLTPPAQKLAPILSRALETATLREFYITAGAESDAEILCSLSSHYNWRDSKYVHPADDSEEARKKASENEKLFQRHIYGAINYAAARTGDPRLTIGVMRPAKVVRDAFCGSLCAHNVKRRLEVEYLSYSRSQEQRLYITDIVKYAENRVRAALGIKTRLRVSSLDDKTKAVIDEYFARELPAAVKRISSRKDAEEAEARYYEALYGSEDKGEVSVAAAKEIEQASWIVTERLTSALDNGQESTSSDEDSDTIISGTDGTGVPRSEVAGTSNNIAGCYNVDKADEDEINFINSGDNDDPYAISGGYDGNTTDSEDTISENQGNNTTGGSFIDKLDTVCREFLSTALAGDVVAQAELCRKHGVYADDIAARINEASADDENIGDIILELTADGFYTVIEDYKEEITV